MATESVESRLQQRRRTSKARLPKLVDCCRQINEASYCGFAQQTQSARNPQTSIGGNTTSRLFVKEDHIGRDSLRQQDRGLLAGLQLLHANGRGAGILSYGDPRREAGRPITHGPWRIFVDQFGDHHSAHQHLAVQFVKDVDLTNEDQLV